MLRFNFFGFPVTVRPGHFVVAALLGWPRQGPDADSLLVWGVFILTVFVSVLWHELGHAFAIARYGGTPQIALYEMGGMTQDLSGLRVTPGQSIVISLAGPFFGFFLGGVVFVATVYNPLEMSDLQRQIVRNTLWINVGWGVLNLLPMLPLDGGHVVKAVFEKLTGGKGTRAAAMVTVATAGLVVAGALYVRMFFAAFLFGALGVQAFRMLQKHGEVLDDEGLVVPLQDALADLGDGKIDQAARAAAEVLQEAKSSPVKNAAIELLAWSALAKGSRDDAQKIADQRTDIEEGDDSLLDMALDAHGDDPQGAYARFESLDEPLSALHATARRAALYAALRAQPASVSLDVYAENAETDDEDVLVSAAQRLLDEGFAFKALDIAERHLADGAHSVALAEVAEKAAAFDGDEEKVARYADMAAAWRASASANGG